MSETFRKESHSEELYVDGRFTQDRAVWTEELQRHCEEVYDEEETIKKQKERSSQFNTQGDRKFADEGRRAEVTIDLVLRLGNDQGAPFGEDLCNHEKPVSCARKTLPPLQEL